MADPCCQCLWGFEWQRSEAEERVELLIEEELLETEIEQAADYREGASKAKNVIIAKWSKSPCTGDW